MAYGLLHKRVMTRRPAFVAASLLALVAAAGIGACTPTSKVAEPDIVMKSQVRPDVLAPCLAVELGRIFRDRRPTVDLYRGIHEITVDSPRGEKLAFVEVQSDYAGGSTVRFWNGDLYWPDHRISGVWPDVMRDNWHRFEAAETVCGPQPVAGKPTAIAKPAPAPKPAAVKAIPKATPLEPLVITPPTAASGTSPAAVSTPPASAPAAVPIPAPAATGKPAGAPEDPALLGS
jgi:hypothetical protein